MSVFLLLVLNIFVHHDPEPVLTIQLSAKFKFYKKLKLEKSWVVIVQMTLGGPGCRLQTCRRREAQWFDSTFWAVQAPHFFAPD